MSALDGVPVCTHETIPDTPCRVAEAQAEIYYSSYQECAHSVILLPGFNVMPQWFLAVIYGLALAWCFFGVAIISDIFMEAIEQITSAEKVVRRPGRDGKLRTIKVLVWNPTVANLTLMALGSSAPEIMLAVLEAALTLGRAPGELGPSTIVGSAAFNLLVISAVCIMSVPEGQVRAIADFPVFICTTAFSLWAYLWMLIVYKFWTPDVVTLTEALLTLAFLPIMVTLAYVINARPWRLKLASDADDEASCDGAAARKEANPTDGLEAGYRIVGADFDMDDGQPMHIRGADIPGLAGIAASHEPTPHAAARRSSDVRRTLSLDEQRVAKVLNGVHEDDLGAMQHVAMDLVNQRTGQAQRPMTAIQYKINARKAVTGRAHVGSSVPSVFSSGAVSPDPSAAQPLATVQFAANAYTCAEHQGHIKLQVLCTRLPGHEKAEVRVRYATRDGSAVSGSEPTGGCDYERASGELIFAPNTSAAEIVVRVYEDDVVEAEEQFFVDLAPSPGCPVDIPRPSVVVVIMDSTQPGRLMFSEPVREVTGTARVAMVPVARKQGADGRASVKFRTADADAVAGTHYTHTEGVLVFETGEKEKDIAVPILGGDVDLHFRVELHDATHADLNTKRALCDVYFVADKKFGMVMRMVQSIMRRQDTQRAAHPWLAQFREAVIPGGACADDGDDGLQSSARLQTSDYILHYVSISWKVLFATVPPAEYHGGIPCFAVSIIYIAAVTFIVGEFAALFGCAVGLPDAVTAISFVALGTSLPDTFASRQAALDSPDADAAIGNVTGSNSVNVFLGLGLPWLLQSLYWRAKGSPFNAPAGAVSFSVTVYMCCSLVCLCLLCYKRVYNGGELGGKGFSRTGIAAVLFALWVLYLALSGMQAMGRIKGF